MSRVLEPGMQGADVALLQRDLNVWHAYWGAPARVMLDRDGDFGPKTELAFRRARVRLGLPRRERAGRTQVIPRDRLIVRHLGRFMVAKRAGETYEMPASVKRTAAEIARGQQARDYERRLKARFRKMREEAEPRPEITASVVNQSSRNGVKPRIIVLHTTEGPNRPGLSDLRGLVSFFDNPSSQVSSHVANDADGNAARIVPDERKAFTQAAFNSVALSRRSTSRSPSARSHPEPPGLCGASATATHRSYSRKDRDVAGGCSRARLGRGASELPSLSRPGIA